MPILIAYGVRIYPWTTNTESTKIPTITPGGFIPTASPNFRFHALYDKVYRKDVLVYAYERCQANGGAAGVDSQTFENIEAHGRERWLDELTQELRSRTSNRSRCGGFTYPSRMGSRDR